MGLYDRDYTQADFSSQRSGFRYAPQLSFPTLTPVVKWLLIINVAVFLASVIIRPLADFSIAWLSVYPATVGMSLQLWRLLTYQFLHDTSGFGHIFVNMLALFFFGPMLERFWGSKRFLVFYLVCGAMGGVVYPVLANIGWLDKGPLVGASGSVLGILAAGAILFPHLRVYVWGIFPVKLMVLAIIFAAISILTLLQPDQFGNAGGQAAHLGGMAAGAAYVLSQSLRDKLKLKLRTGQWEKRMATQRNLQAELDRILKKVHDSGLQSLTSKEKSTLKEATKAEQMRNRF
ncbi:MAG: rhomboid family intramembrane serine protease [Phycisphaerales bacterium]|nr:MAG: rhomboid family intramembrane serine protease [Phycisphaerales bacterium]